MTKTELSRIIEEAGRLCDDLLGTHPMDTRLHSSQAVLNEALAFVQSHWPETFSDQTITVDSSDEVLNKIQSRLMIALTVLNSFTTEMRRAQIESGK